MLFLIVFPGSGDRDCQRCANSAEQGCQRYSSEVVAPTDLCAEKGVNVSYPREFMGGSGRLVHGDVLPCRFASLTQRFFNT